MLKAEGLKRTFGSIPVIQNINLSIETGEVVSIVGASGAGKTTLLQLLGTLDKPDEGKIHINNINPFILKELDLAKFRNNHIGFVFQFHQLLPEFTALENVMMPALIGGKSQESSRERAMMLLERLSVGNRADHQPMALSGGEQQRVAVARALMNQPSIIFADEPSGNLDATHAASLHNLFFELREEFNLSFVIVTHNDQLAKMADRTLTMSKGELI